MKRTTATVSVRNQVTIPAEVRRALGVKPGARVDFSIDGNEVSLAPATFTVESADGSVRPAALPEDFEAASRFAQEARAEKTLGKLRNA